MKKFLITATFAIAAICVQAQFSIGFKGGFNLTNVSFELDEAVHLYDGEMPEFRFTPGFQVGLVADFGISESFSIQPGILFSRQGGRAQWTDWERDSWGSGNWEEWRYRQMISLNYIQIPINVQYKLPLGRNASFILQAGPYVGFAIGGKHIFEFEEKGRMLLGETAREWDRSGGEFMRIKFGSDNISLEDGDGLIFRRLDFGVGFGLGAQVGSFQIRAGYNLGLRNFMNQFEFEDWDTGEIVTTSDNSIRNSGITLSVTYLFGANRAGRGGRGGSGRRVW